MCRVDFGLDDIELQGTVSGISHTDAKLPTSGLGGLS